MEFSGDFTYTKLSGLISESYTDSRHCDKLYRRRATDQMHRLQS